MRNAFVVLVSLCIGLVSGFIVPSSVPELKSKKNNSRTETSRDVEVKATMFPAKFAVLPKSRNDIDEKDLYEHATEKKNNQSERAFIYINQKYKKPVRNKIIKMLPIDHPDFGRAHVTPPPTLPSVAQTPCPSTFDSGSNSNSYFQGFEFSDKQPQEMASYFAGPNIFRCNFHDESKKTKDNSKAQMQVPASNRADERRDYFELLKPPILRPVNRVSTKVNYDANHHNDFPSLSPSNVPYKENYLKKYNLKNQYLSKAKAAVARHDEIRKNYGFDGAFIRRPAYHSKELISRVENVNFEGDFINEDDSHRIYENNQEDDKLLDKYLKDTLEEQISSNDKVSANTPDCSYRDCILQSSKQYTNNGLLIKPDCKCGRRLNIKQVDPFLAKDRSLREETKRNETVLKSSEVNYYEEILSDDSNMVKQDDDVVRPPNKFNETSAH